MIIIFFIRNDDKILRIVIHISVGDKCLHLLRMSTTNDSKEMIAY